MQHDQVSINLRVVVVVSEEIIIDLVGLKELATLSDILIDFDVKFANIRAEGTFFKSNVFKSLVEVV
jgi:hypothetical protein